MSDISATESELLRFFEVVPTLSDPNDPWVYNDALYELSRGDLRLSFAVAPANKDVRITLTRGSDKLYELNALAVQDVKYRDDGGRESVEVVLTELDRMLLFLKPAIELLHELGDRA
jgi:hypothetical protein